MNIDSSSQEELVGEVFTPEVQLATFGDLRGPGGVGLVEPYITPTRTPSPDSEKI